LAILRRVILNGFKSIKTMDLQLRPLNVLIGANGAGKSNLVSFFKMLNEMMAGKLQQYIATNGRAQSLLHYGAKQTQAIEAVLEFETDQGRPAFYYARLFHAAGDTLAIGEWMDILDRPDKWRSVRLVMGQWETWIGKHEDVRQLVADDVRKLLDGFRVYHFHDTSTTARVRQYCYIGDNHKLLADAGNLAAFLLRLRDIDGGRAYKRIVATVRLLAPFFDDFVLDESGTGTGAVTDVMLNWRDKGSDQVFGPHQLSDGTLRAMCLVTLLLQPENELPDLIIVDEPELGLHPYALNLIASLFKKASHHTQVLISTQSSSFLDNFDAEDVVVVSRDGNESRFARPDAEMLEKWLEEYSLGEVWEKNVIGGGPH
jgi:predicted ATPase